MRSKNGRFGKGQSGNPQGRPKGSKNLVSEDFLADTHAAWKKHGPEALQRMIEERPSEFVKMVAQLVPKDFHLTQSVLEQPSLSVALDPDSALAKRLGKSGVDSGVPALSES